MLASELRAKAVIGDAPLAATVVGIALRLLRALLILLPSLLLAFLRLLVTLFFLPVLLLLLVLV
ncbi:MAG: hypothetical protein ACRD4S_01535 [Candidatus Acidiferrales bacterium]